MAPLIMQQVRILADQNTIVGSIPDGFWPACILAIARLGSLVAPVQA